MSDHPAGRRHIMSFRANENEERLVRLLAGDWPSVSDYLRALVKADAKQRLPVLLEIGEAADGEAVRAA